MNAKICGITLTNAKTSFYATSRAHKLDMNEQGEVECVPFVLFRPVPCAPQEFRAFLVFQQDSLLHVA